MESVQDDAGVVGDWDRGIPEWLEGAHGGTGKAVGRTKMMDLRKCINMAQTKTKHRDSTSRWQQLVHELEVSYVHDSYEFTDILLQLSTYQSSSSSDSSSMSPSESSTAVRMLGSGFAAVTTLTLFSSPSSLSLEEDSSSEES